MTTSNLKIAVRTLYDFQPLRISVGNRIVASFRSKGAFGENGTPSENEQQADVDKAIKLILDEFRRITDGIVKITKVTKLPESTLITNYGEIKLIENYERLLTTEEEQIKLVKYEVEQCPFYPHFLKKVRGLGPVISGVILSEVDIHKCNSIAALWAYTGLDVVFKDVEGEVVGEGRSRRKEHLIPKTYIKKSGEEVNTVGISFNPLLKTKLIGVLGPSFLISGGVYRDVYLDYKSRLQNHPKHQSKTKAHIHRMSVRYMVKEFLADMWTAWRTFENLPLKPRYEEAKLGIIHSGPSRLDKIMGSGEEQDEDQ